MFGKSAIKSANKPHDALLVYIALLALSPLLAALLGTLIADLIFRGWLNTSWTTLTVGICMLLGFGILAVREARRLTRLQVRAYVRSQLKCLAVALAAGAVKFALTIAGHTDDMSAPELPVIAEELLPLIMFFAVLIMFLQGLAGVVLLFFRRHRKAGIQLFLIGTMAVWWFKIAEPDHMSQSPQDQTDVLSIPQPAQETAPIVEVPPPEETQE